MAACRILSHQSAPFQDRVEAGQLLGRELAKLRGQGAVVLGIPRGGVVVAREVARALDGELDIVLSRKIGAPGNPEFAIGAVSEDGRVFLTEASASWLRLTSDYIERETARQRAEIARRIGLYRSVRPKVPIEGRPVVVTDDGVATGATMQAALWAARQERPARLVAALPVAPEEALARLAADTDELLCLQAPPDFQAVSQFYSRFDQTDDSELLDLLREEAERSRTP
jgi:predicted phosphoribosyltransferase